MHAKTLAGTTLYGLPMARARVASVGPQPTSTAPAPLVGISEPAAQRVARLLVVRPGRTYTFVQSAMIERNVASAGRYVSFGGDEFGSGGMWAEAGEPIQPRFIGLLSSVDGDIRSAPVHFVPRSAVLRGGTYRDLSAFQPVVRRASILESSARTAIQQAPGFTAPGWYPALPAEVSQFRGIPGTGSHRLAGEHGRLLVSLGQYHPSRRTERLYSSLALDEYYSASDDYEPPIVEWVRGNQAGTRIAFAVRAHDPSGIAAVVLVFTDNGGAWESTQLAWSSMRQVWEGSVPLGVEGLLQVVDGAGNLTVDDNGGRLYRAQDVTPPPPPPSSRIFLPLALREECKTAQLYADVALVVDVSTSMRQATRGGRPKINAVVAATQQLVSGLRLQQVDADGPHDRVAVIGFNHEAWVETLLTGNRAVIDASLAALPSRMAEGTRLDLALQAGTDVLRTGRVLAPKNLPVLILLTDGVPTGVDEATVRQAAATTKAAGVQVYTIGVGRADATDPSERVNSILLRDSASHPSMYFEEPDAEALNRIYAEIARTIGCSPVDFWSGR
jgi:Mg-chelatase subunit ChlD